MRAVLGPGGAAGAPEWWSGGAEPPGWGADRDLWVCLVLGWPAAVRFMPHWHDAESRGRDAADAKRARDAFLVAAEPLVLAAVRALTVRHNGGLGRIGAECAGPGASA